MSPLAVQLRIRTRFKMDSAQPERRDLPLEKPPRVHHRREQVRRGGIDGLIDSSVSLLETAGRGGAGLGLGSLRTPTAVLRHGWGRGERWEMFSAS